MTDHELAKGILNGDKSAQQELWRLYSRKMMSVSLRYCNSRPEAEDVLQDAFVKVFQRIDQWQGSGPLGGWIRTVVVNTALTQLRKDNKWRHSADLDAADNLNADDVDAVSKMNAESLMELIDKMPKGYKTVFNLFAVEGFGHKEIGDMLGISENTSKTQFLKAKSWLKRNLTSTTIQHEESEEFGQ
jgi:RNA polymerase sigma factor (sigma-70 family)